MVVFKKEKTAKFRLPYCIDFKRNCVKDVTPSIKPIAPALCSTNRRTIFIDFHLIHNQASNTSFRMRKATYHKEHVQTETCFS